MKDIQVMLICNLAKTLGAHESSLGHVDLQPCQEHRELMKSVQAMLICNLAKDPERFTPLSHLILDRLSLTSLPGTQVQLRPAQYILSRIGKNLYKQVLLNIFSSIRFRTILSILYFTIIFTLDPVQRGGDSRGEIRRLTQQRRGTVDASGKYKCKKCDEISDSSCISL